MFASLLAQAISFPAWPSSYTIIGTWKVPYTNLSNPITVVHSPGRQYQNQLNGIEQIWRSGPEERIHRKIVGTGNGTICYGIPDDQPWELEITQFLPDPEGFNLVPGEYTYHGKVCDLWEKVVDSNKTQTYRMYIDKQGNPVAYVSKAISIFHSHYDVYILEIDTFIRDVLPGYWNIPSICNNFLPDPYPGDQMGFFFPKASSHKNVQKNVRARLASGDKTNGRYAHLDKSEFMKNVEIQRKARNDRLKRKGDTQYCPVWKGTGKELPRTFSWRNNTQVVGKPRDQVACGSCWAFGTAEVLEGAFGMASKEFHEVSTNQIMDCTFGWGDNNYGCQGGEVDIALDALKNKKIRIAKESDYPYLGASSQYCDNNKDDYLGTVTGCYKIEPRTRSVMEAIYTFGPLGIAINVIEPMMLYTNGVIDDETCTGAQSDLVHAVLLTGWAEIDGKLAWEVKNSWSTYWGWDGYIYIQMEDQTKNCGVTTDAVAAVVSLKQN